jgi:hypothetical protein
LSLTRTWICRLQLLLASPVQSFLGPSPAGLMTIFYCLRFDIPPFCQSYFTTGGLTPISLSWRQAPWDSWPEFFSPQLNPFDISPCVTSSLKRRWVCQLWICLAFRQVYISHI